MATQFLDLKTGTPVIADPSAPRAGEIQMYAGVLLPSGFFDVDGAEYSATTYSDLYKALTLSVSMTTVSASTSVTVLSTANIKPGFTVYGAGIPSGTKVLSITSATVFVLTAAATASATISGTLAPYDQQINTVLGSSWALPAAGNFRVPDMRGVFPRAAGSNFFGEIFLGNYQSDQMQGHVHTAIANGGTGGSTPQLARTTNGGAPSPLEYADVIGSPRTDGANGTPRVGQETRPVNRGMKFIIRVYDSTTAGQVGGSGSGGLSPSAISSATTAVTNKMYLVDTSAAGFALTLPGGTTEASVGFLDATGLMSDTLSLTITPATGQSIGVGAVNESWVARKAYTQAVLYRAAGSSVWRVQMQSSNVASPATATDIGLVSGNNVPASNGVSPLSPTAKGSYVTSAVGFVAFTASGTWQNLTSISLTAGNYLVSSLCQLAHNGATTAADFNLAISAIAGVPTDVSTCINRISGQATTSSQNDSVLTLTNIAVRCDGTNITINGITSVGTTLYMKNVLQYSGVAPIRAGSITAVRV